jgi:hypothetical protein
LVGGWKYHSWYVLSLISCEYSGNLNGNRVLVGQRRTILTAFTANWKWGRAASNPQALAKAVCGYIEF